MDETPQAMPLTPLTAGIRGLCPRCGEGHIFRRYLKIAPRCEVCGLDFSFSDTADGPAFFAMSIVSPFSVALALWLEFTFEPPLWVQMVTTLPFTIIGCMVFLQPLKGWLVCSQYRNIERERDGH